MNVGSPAAPGSPRPALPALGRLVLVVSGMGFPLTQAVIARFGRRGAAVAEGVAAWSSSGRSPGCRTSPGSRPPGGRRPMGASTSRREGQQG
jgi:hypothetical protein